MSKESQQQMDQQPAVPQPLESGLTWRVILALTYIVVVFQAPLIFLYLMTGGISAVTMVQWATLLLAVELARISGRPLKRQEAVLIFLASWQATRFTWFLGGAMAGINPTAPGWIYQLYLKYSPITTQIGIRGAIPWFYAPTDPSIWIDRAFFSSAWVPILLITTYFTITQEVCNMLLGIIGYYLYYKVEKLPFPTFRPTAEVVLTLTEREPSRLSILSVTALISFIYGIVIYFLPLVTGVLWNVPRGLTLIPIPYADFNNYLHRVLPGASFGLPTDPLSFVFGFIVPLPVAVGMFIGSFAFQFVGNALLIRMFGNLERNPWNLFAAEFQYGMSSTDIWQRSMLHVWASPLIGMALVAGVMPLILNPRLLTRAFKSLSEAGSSGAAEAVGIPLWGVIGGYIGFTVGLTILDYFLAPDLPIYIYVFLNTIWPFFYMLVTTRGDAEAVTFSVPYVREATILFSGYGGFNGWFAPIYVPVSWTSSYAVADMTGTKPRSYIAAAFLVYPLALILGLFYVQSFWSMAPIPSSIYPGTQIFWPVQAIYQLIWVKGQQALHLDWLLAGAVAIAAASVGLNFVGLASSIIGFIAGAFSVLPSSLGTLIGHLVGLIIQKYIGREWFYKYRAVIIAGVSLGIGLSVGIASAAAIILRSMWIKPF